jgi:hypothetical protein
LTEAACSGTVRRFHTWGSGRPRDHHRSECPARVSRRTRKGPTVGTNLAPIRYECGCRDHRPSATAASPHPNGRCGEPRGAAKHLCQ